ncbi:hypothetical protein HPQ31_04760 [Acinetobacter nosocomialis]|uniref:hypothetical protein n=1 Tax=Acinetobacter nosocomialis TaxID=106654 RepID=UPI0016613051|nr:hypothetical protein [Acinetobacter nosocomialis]MBD0443645.1 hypothetical protein [Acinetobacter nosocomialis]
MTFEEITNKIAASVVLLSLISSFPYMGYKFYLVAMDDSRHFVIKYVGRVKLEVRHKPPN